MTGNPDASSYAKKFSGKYSHRIIKGDVAPQAFAQAVVDVRTVDLTSSSAFFSQTFRQ